MPISYQISGKTIRVTLSGKNETDDIRQVVARILSDPAFADDLHLLLDSRESTANPSVAQIRARAVLLKSVVEDRPVRIAFLVSGTLRYGLARMFSVYAQMEGLNIEVFKDIDEACHWIEQA